MPVTTHPAAGRRAPLLNSPPSSRRTGTSSDVEWRAPRQRRIYRSAAAVDMARPMVSAPTETDVRRPSNCAFGGAAERASTDRRWQRRRRLLAAGGGRLR
jgi:hypothetical protein